MTLSSLESCFDYSNRKLTKAHICGRMYDLDKLSNLPKITDHGCHDHIDLIETPQFLYLPHYKLEIFSLQVSASDNSLSVIVLNLFSSINMCIETQSHKYYVIISNDKILETIQMFSSKRLGKYLMIHFLKEMLYAC